MFGKLSLFFITVLMLSCAQPRYENIITEDNSSPPSEKLTNCTLRFSNSGWCVLWTWEQKPIQKKAGQFILKIMRPNLLDETPVYVEAEDNIAVVLFMPKMNHGSRPTKVTKLDVGTYRISNVVFIMPGEWEIKFQLKQNGAVIDEAIFPLIH